MLVLNTNDQNGGGKTANEGILSPTYPDFSQILIKPSFNMYSGGTLPTIESINGTALNCATVDINSLNWNNPNASLLGGGPISLFNGTYNTTLKFASNGSLKGGEIIGKKIILGCCQVYGGSGSQGINIKLGLIHTDGTITYFTSGGTTVFQVRVPAFTGSSPYIYGSSTIEARPSGRGFLIVNTNGIVALSGDRIYGEVESVGTSDTSYGDVGFGNTIGGGSTGRYSSGSHGKAHQAPCTPIQISIE